jgi:DNA repair protein RAD16
MDLIKHHPELEDVWGDLEAKVEIVEPVKAPQPTAVSRKLLPFQLEGLHWMQTQEAGLWKGGMRASVSWSLRSRLSLYSGR